jgi:prevent-host-death family protein
MFSNFSEVISMKRDSFDQETRPITDFGSNAVSFIEQVRQTKKPIVITQDGKDAAVLLGAAEYEALLEKLAISQDVHQAEIQLRDGKGVEHEVARGRILARLRP